MEINLFDTAQKQDTAALYKKAFTVYKGMIGDEIVYIGTTIQRPCDRFRWHKANGKNFKFEIIAQFSTEQEMLDLEFELIKKHNPKYNKITHRKQNLNRKLTVDVLASREGNSEWCQGCLKRRVNKGYKFCFYCS